MATKSKGWTARLPVKICCVILIPIMVFISLYGAYGLTKLDNISLELLFANLDYNDYFYDKYMPGVLSYVYTLYWMRSEEYIRNMGCLEWQERMQFDYDNDSEEYSPVAVYDLVSSGRGNQWHWGTNLTYEELDSAYAKRMVEEAITQLLAEFRYAKKRLEEIQGLSFVIGDESWHVGNVDANTGIDYFRSQPVYWISDKGGTIEQSNANSVGNTYIDFGYGYRNVYYDYSNYDLSCSIAFDNYAVSRQNETWKSEQRQMERKLTLIAAPLVITIACFIILICGAGRKHGTDSTGSERRFVHFIAIDRLWLDIGLCFTAAFEALVIYLFYEAATVAWQSGNDRWIIVLCAALSVFSSLPLLGWLLSFVKHCKAGKFLRHTFIYVFFHWLFAGLKKLGKSVWAGFPLTMKAVLLGVALFVINVLCIGLYGYGPTAPFLAFVLSAAALLLMLRYAHRLRLVVLGAKAASEGRYGNPIDVTGGELGSISASINSISDGINSAVAERMKSERLRTELITNISHDIRTPLTSLITYSDLLKNEGLDNERAPEYLDVLIQKSARLKTLTDDLFEASKAASGNIEVHVEDLDLADFVRQVLGELDEKVRASNLDFRLDLPEHAHVRADGRLLWRVMENLLSNVFKYALPGSRVYIDVTGDAPDTGGGAYGAPARQARQGDGSLVLGYPVSGSLVSGSPVLDEQDGRTVPLSSMSSVWYRLDVKNISEHPLNIEPSELTERFKRGDDARSGDGSGLGLSIAQSFVLAQGGRFELSIDGDLFKASVCLPGA